MAQTKDMRLVLKRKQHIEQFNSAKAKAERELGYTLRDNEFATRVLVQALKPQDERKPEMGELVSLLTDDLRKGGPFARAFEKNTRHKAPRSIALTRGL